MTEQRDRVVFIIGAGASAEVGMPVGEQLKPVISDLLDLEVDQFHSHIGKGSQQIYQALHKHTDNLKHNTGLFHEYLYEGKHISKALPLGQSIDNFIDNHRGNEKIELCGKLAIANAILEAERKSKLFVDPSNIYNTLDLTDIQDTWYLKFFNMIAENCSFEDLEIRFKQISLIVFNYDRCLEHFIFNAIKLYYRVDDEESASLIKHLNIYHPYGLVGYLPWEQRSPVVPFGGEPHPDRLLELASELKTFTEGTSSESSEIQDIHNDMLRAYRLVFLGFAFHRLNMRLITPRSNSRVIGPTTFATAFRVSFNDQEVVQNRIRALYNTQSDGPVNVSDLTCFDLFASYSLSLSLAD